MKDRTYRLTGRHRGTAMLGLKLPQVVILAVAGIVAVVLFTRQHLPTTLVGIAVAAAGGWTAFGTLHRQPVHQHLPALVEHLIRRVRRRQVWTATVPLLSCDGDPTADPAVPRCFAGFELLAVERPDWATDLAWPPGAPIGLIRDRHRHTLTAVVKIAGSDYTLLEPAQQHQRIAAWGRVLGQFARDTSPVCRIVWHEWATPSPLTDHEQWIDQHHTNDPRAVADYRQVLAEIGVGLARHELYVTITIDPRRLTNHEHRRTVEPVAAALEAVQALSERCRSIGLNVTAPFTPADVSIAIRTLIDPTTPPTRVRSLGVAERVGALPAVATLPSAIGSEWDHVRVDASYHRAYAVAAWPAGDLGPRWLEPLLLGAAGTRTITLMMEPIDRRTSRRRINAEAVKLQGEISNRQHHGFRVPVDVQRAQDDLDVRETELHNGYAEYRFAALINLTAPSLDELDANSRTILALADDCGLELRRLDARHDLALTTSVPLGRHP